MSSSGYQSYPDPANNGVAQGGQYHQSGYPAQNNAGASAVGPSVVSPFSPNLSPHFSATTAMLALLSLITLYEGTWRVIGNSASDATWSTGYGYFPAAAVLVGGIWESLYAIITLFVAIWALVFDWHSVTATTLALITQLGGIYTIIVFAIAQPAYYYSHQQDPSMGQVDAKQTTNETRATYVFGWILSMLSVELAVLAAMMFFTIQLMQIQMNRVDELHSPFYYSRRLGFWSFLQMVLGFSQIIYGAIEAAKVSNHLATPVSFYPNFTNYTSIIIVSGIIFLLLGAFGMITSCINNLHLSNLYIGANWLTFIYVIAVHVCTSTGTAPIPNPTNNDYAAIGMNEMGMMFGGVLLMPMFLAYKAATIETVERGHYGYGPQNNQANRPLVV